jgi:hypothetical protein
MSNFDSTVDERQFIVAASDYAGGKAHLHSQSFAVARAVNRSKYLRLVRVAGVLPAQRTTVTGQVA